MTKKQAKEIADKIKKDICGRSGGDGWFGGCDKEIQKEIVDSWARIVLDGCRKATV